MYCFQQLGKVNKTDFLPVQNTNFALITKTINPTCINRLPVLLEQQNCEPHQFALVSLD